MRQAGQDSTVCFPVSFISEYGPRIGADGIGIALILLSRADSDGISRVGVRFLKRNLRIGQASITQAIHALESCGIVSVERRRGAGHNAELRFYLREPLHQPNITRLDTRRGRASAAR